MSAMLMLASCGDTEGATASGSDTTVQSGSGEATGRNNVQSESGMQVKEYTPELENAVKIELSDSGITVDGEAVSTDESSAVYVANDIVYYEDGKDFTYGEGTEEDAHTKEEASAHTVVHITQPGTYALSGSLSAGQVAVDLGEDAEENPEAVVTLVLNEADITCTVAPAVIFYNVYECGSTDEESAVKEVDTSAAGANIVIADGTENHINGSYVARIYKSVELNEAGTEVVDSKKLHKYDAAFYSKMSMNVDGGDAGNGILNIMAENEGLDSELHLTMNGGVVNIESGNDGINTNEDYVSVTTVNGGKLNILVNGSTGEGDGIDSNGWLVINGGTVVAQACATSGDAGIDSDMGIHINGGTVIATGNMLDHISESEQTYAVFSFASSQKGDATYTLKDANGEVVLSAAPENSFTYLIFSDEKLMEGTYTMWQDDTQLAGMAAAGGMGMGFRGGMQDGEMPQMPEGAEPPEGWKDGKMPQMPEGMEPPEGWKDGEMPTDGRGGGKGGFRGQNSSVSGEVTPKFQIQNGGNYFERCGTEK